MRLHDAPEVHTPWTSYVHHIVGARSDANLEVAALLAARQLQALVATLCTF
jgi:hypothetical protein